MISMILTTYNGEKYLRRCLDSLVNQTIEKNLLEIIVVDDASSDASIRILNEYKDNYNGSFTVIRCNVNSAITRLTPRNIGVRAAQGKYIMFCDQDDWYRLDTCKILYDEMETYKMLDFIEYGFDYVDDDENYLKRAFDDNSTFTIYDLKSGIEKTELVKDRIYPGYSFVWNKIYSKSFLIRNNIFHNEGEKITGYGDNFFSGMMYLYANRFGKDLRSFYNYRIWNGSYTSGKKNEVARICGRIDTGRVFMEECEERGLLNVNKEIVYLWFFRVIYEKVFWRLLEGKAQENFEKLRGLRAFVLQKCPDWDSCELLYARQKMQPLLQILKEEWTDEYLMNL